MWLETRAFPPLRRGLLSSPWREWLARRALAQGWDAHFGGERPISTPGQAGLFVSLTSHPPRYGTLALTLRSLLLQNLRPEAVLLWIGHGDMAALPGEVRALEDYGVRIVACEDHRSHTKYVHALDRLPGADIAICDDDTFYPSDWLARLVAARRPRAIASHRVHRVVLDGWGRPLGYRQWDHDIAGPGASPLHFATGVGGMLLRRDLLDPRVLDMDAANRLCPTADDIWLHFMGRLAGSIAYHTGWTDPLVTWVGSQGIALWRVNNLDDGNDRCLAAMTDHFGYALAHTPDTLAA